MTYVVWEQTVSSDWTSTSFATLEEAKKYVDGIIKGRLKNNGFCITKYISSNYPEWFKPLRKP